MSLYDISELFSKELASLIALFVVPFTGRLTPASNWRRSSVQVIVAKIPRPEFYSAKPTFSSIIRTIICGTSPSAINGCDLSVGVSLLFRLQKELMVLMMSTEQGVSAFPEGENLFKWIGTITGPKDTVRLRIIRYRVILNYRL